ncbi:MAG: MoaD/ThiS family protein [bacterium]|nr:MoaD/ThiS family protein [bacterium]
MHEINIKLFAHLREFMPGPSIRGEAPYDCPEDNTINMVLNDLNVPLEHCHLVLVNGVFIHPEERDNQTLEKGDTLSVWPPIAGG